MSDKLELIDNYSITQLGYFGRGIREPNSLLYDKQSKSFVIRDKEGKYANVNEDQLYKIYVQLSKKGQDNLLKYNPNIEDKLINTYFK